MLQEVENKPLIEIDGGVANENYEDLLLNGANVLVAGSSVFKSDNPAEAISVFKQQPKNTLMA